MERSGQILGTMVKPPGFADRLYEWCEKGVKDDFKVLACSTWRTEITIC
jgi:hypothetical protein